MVSTHPSREVFVMNKHFLTAWFVLLGFIALCLPVHSQTPVETWGQLHVEGTKIVSEQGEPVALRGMSLFWSQWIGKYYNDECVQWLKEDWQCTVIRAAMAVESGGYLQNPDTEFAKVETVIEACIDQGIYVIVDWHDHTAENHVEAAIEFFTTIAQYYGDTPNLIYEIYNEPLQVSWLNVVKPYADTLVSEIRAIDPDNLIIVGTPTWSQDVDAASRNPVVDDNVAYGLHFYSGTHTQWLRNKALTAMNNGAALFVSEFGVCESNGSGDIYYEETEKWFDFMKEHMISWCNWSIADKDETSAALKPGASATGGWSEAELSESGAYIRDTIITWHDSSNTSVRPEPGPNRFRLVRHYPNPFNEQAVIQYWLSEGTRVQAAVFDVRGHEILNLLDAWQPAGDHVLRFNAHTLPSGLYTARLQTGKHCQQLKMIHVK